MIRMNSRVPLSRGAVMALMLLVWQVSHQALAEDNMSFSGTLINAPNCTVNGNNRIDVNFGDSIVTREVDGLKYSQPVEYDLDCTSIAVNGLTVAVRGNPAAFGTGLIAAGRAGLAIQLWSNDKPIANGETVPFTWPTKPVLRATPVAQDNTTLTAGTFSSTASLVLNYQ